MMNEKEINNLLFILNKYSALCVSVALFTDILQDQRLTTLIEPITNKNILTSGLYLKILGKDIYVINDTSKYIKIALHEPPLNNKKESDWSPSFKLETFDPSIFERSLNLKAFW